MPSPQDPLRLGLVYYALDATRLHQRVKIGFSSKLEERLTALRMQTASRQRPILLAVEAGDMALETQRHAEFRDLRVAGEWFNYGMKLSSHIADLPNPHAFLADRPELWQYAKGVPGVPRIPIEEADALEPDAEIEF